MLWYAMNGRISLNCHTHAYEYIRYFLSWLIHKYTLLSLFFRYCISWNIHASSLLNEKPNVITLY